MKKHHDIQKGYCWILFPDGYMLKSYDIHCEIFEKTRNILKVKNDFIFYALGIVRCGISYHLKYGKQYSTCYIKMKYELTDLAFNKLIDTFISENPRDIFVDCYDLVYQEKLVRKIQKLMGNNVNVISD